MLQKTHCQVFKMARNDIHEFRLTTALELSELINRSLRLFISNLLIEAQKLFFFV